MLSYKLTILIFGILVFFLQSLLADIPCAARAIDGQSVVCVCNDTYCDDFTKVVPDSGSYVAYSSSEGGLRFNKVSGGFENVSVECCNTTLTLDPSIKYQTIEGFGGAVTDSAGINWKNLSEALQTHLINSYFSDNGIQYNMLRVPIGGCDFSTHAYAYNELPENDTLLTNFSLSYEDVQYKIPMIKAIMQTASSPVEIVATTWSPPVWMKSNHKFVGHSSLLPDYYQTYADYHLKFLQRYETEGIKVWAITTTNEPLNGLLPISLTNINSLGWSPDDMGKWIVQNLGPTIRNSSFKDLKILAHDDQRFSIPVLFDKMIEDYPGALNYLDGVAVHYYGDFLAPASILAEIPQKYPGKFVLATEACEGSFPWEFEKVKLGSWKRAVTYIEDILEDLNYDVVGWIDWNLCLNAQGGPNWDNNYVDSPIIVFPENQEFVKQPMFYAMGHFSKFIPRGSIRIKVVEKHPLLEKAIKNVAFLTPQGTIVVVIYNPGELRTVGVKLEEKIASIRVDAHSVTTVEFVYEANQ